MFKKIGTVIQFYISKFILVLFVAAIGICIRASTSAAASNKYVVLILGPGGSAYGKEHHEAWQKALAKNFQTDHVITIGDGVSPLSADAIGETLKQTQAYDPLIIVNAHGTSRAGKFLLRLGNNYIPAEELFTEVVRPANIFMASCHSGACLMGNNKFPAGSMIVATSSEGDITSGFDIERFVKILGQSEINGKETPTSELLFLYLCHSLKNRISPEVLYKGQVIRPSALLKTKIGNPFSPEEQTKVMGQLDDLVPRGDLEVIMRKISAAKSEWEISALEYGRALAVILAARGLKRMSDHVLLGQPHDLRTKTSCLTFYR